MVCQLKNLIYSLHACYPEGMAIDKTNELLSVMTVCRKAFHNGAMAHTCYKGRTIKQVGRRGKGRWDLSKNVYSLFWWHHSFVKMRIRREGVKYLTYLRVHTLWMTPIHESAIHRTFVACVVSMEAIFPCFNLKPDDCNLATTILVHKLSQLY